MNKFFLNKLHTLLLFTVLLTTCFTSIVVGQKQLSLSFDTQSTTKFLCPPRISSVINDESDPATKYGLFINVLEDNNIIRDTNFQVVVSSNGNSVLNAKNIKVSKKTGKIHLLMIPNGVGFCTITVEVSYKKQTATINIEYAASDNSVKDGLYHTGISDASAAISIDNNTMLVGDDETNQLLLFDTRVSGLPIRSFKYEKLLDLEDGTIDNKKEVDVECAAKSAMHPNMSYWLGSMSNGGKRMDVKPNRNTLFATAISGIGKDIDVKIIGEYHQLRKNLIEWGKTNGYQLDIAASAGMEPKRVDGFNVEGMCFAPDNTTLYVCFRAPIVPVKDRNNALIAPLLNFETWFNNGKPSGKPQFGKPIEIDLNKRGIRDIISLSDKSYLIVAGNSDHIKNAALYKWTGLSEDRPQLLSIPDISNLPIEAAIEVFEDGMPSGKVQLICDNGSTAWYNDGNPSKNLDYRYKKFISKVVKIN